MEEKTVERSLQNTIIQGNTNELITLIKKGVLLNQRLELLLTPLQLAAYLSEREIMQILIEAGADVNMPDLSGRNPLHTCAANGYLDGIHLLASHQVNLDSIDCAGTAAIHLAAENGYHLCVTTLVEYGASPFLIDDAGRSPVHFASKNDHLETVRYFLIDLEQDFQETTSSGVSLLDCSMGITNQYLTLIDHLSSDSLTRDTIPEELLKDDLEFITLECLLKYNKQNLLTDHEVFDILFSKGLHSNLVKRFCKVCMQSNNVAYVHKILLDRVHDLGEKKNILHIAAEVGCTDIIEDAVKIWHVDALKLSDEGLSPAHTAVKFGQIDFYEKFLEILEAPQIQEEIVTSKANNGSTLLHFAAMSNEVRPFLILEQRMEAKDYIKLLLVTDNEGNSTLHHCAKFGAIKVLEHILEYKAIRSHIASDPRNEHNKTPQHLAVLHNNPLVLKKLLRHQANIHLVDSNGNSNLHLAIKAGNQTTLMCLSSNVMNEILHENVNGLTPLAIAKSKQKFAMLTILNQSRLKHTKSLDYIAIDTITKGKANLITLLNAACLKDSQQLIFPDTSKHLKVKDSIVICGGGIKGIAYYGAIKKLVDTKTISLSNVKRVAGTSAGAISALLFSIGSSVEDCKMRLEEIDFNELIEEKHRDFIFALKDGDTESILGENLDSLRNDLSSNKRNWFEKFASVVTRFYSAVQEGKDLFSKVKNLYTTINDKFGIFNGDILQNKFESWIEKMTGIKDCTFRELEDLVKNGGRSESGEKFKSLYLVGFHINSGTIKYFSAEHTPNDVIADALRISMSIPIFFKPHKRHEKINGQKVAVDDGLYVDGGVAKNYPIDIFDDTKYLTNKISHKGFFNDNVLGLKFASGDTAKFYQNKKVYLPPNPENLIDYIKQVISAVTTVQESNFMLSDADHARTIFIDSGDFTAVDFDINAQGQQQLIDAGIEASAQYIERQNAHSKIKFSAKARDQVKQVLAMYIGISSQILFAIPLEKLWRAKVDIIHGPLMLFKLITLPVGLTAKQIISLVANFNLDFSQQDVFGNTVAHYLAITNEFKLIKILYNSIKPSLLLVRNVYGLTAIGMYLLGSHQNSYANENAWEGFCHSTEDANLIEGLVEQKKTVKQLTSSVKNNPKRPFPNFIQFFHNLQLQDEDDLLKIENDDNNDNNAKF